MSPETRYISSTVQEHPEHCDADITAAVAQIQHPTRSSTSSPCLFCHWDVAAQSNADQTDVPEGQQRIERTLPNGCPLFGGVKETKYVLVRNTKKRGV